MWSGRQVRLRARRQLGFLYEVDCTFMFHCVAKFTSHRLEDCSNHTDPTVVLFYNVADCIFRHEEVLLTESGTRLNTAQTLRGFYERVANGNVPSRRSDAGLHNEKAQPSSGPGSSIPMVHALQRSQIALRQRGPVSSAGLDCSLDDRFEIERSPFICCFIIADALNTTTRRGEIGTSTPVFGFRPIRSPFRRTSNVPNDDSLTVSPLRVLSAIIIVRIRAGSPQTLRDALIETNLARARLIALSCPPGTQYTKARLQCPAWIPR